MPRERILITVKTYPTLSRKYGETVCTAVLRTDGSWVRLYPVPFRRLDEAEQYRKFDWLECDVVRSTKDPRPETHHPANMRQLVPAGHMDTADNWRERRGLVLGRAKVYTRLQTLMDGAKDNALSLAVFKPTRITDFIWEQEEREWDTAKLTEMRNRANQGEMCAEESWRQTFDVIRKMPFSFSYRFEDETGKASEVQVLDWEAGALFWKCLANVEQLSKCATELKEAEFAPLGDEDTNGFLQRLIQGLFPSAGSLIDGEQSPSVAEEDDSERSLFSRIPADGGAPSQCDPTSLFALYLGHQTIIVGDDEQVTPVAVGVQSEEVSKLIRVFLQGVPHKELYDGETSIYELAQIAFGGVIRLTEHFRCAPSIIAFSNALSYKGEVKSLREASSIPLRPHVVPYRVRDGHDRGDNVNDHEAETIASLVCAAIQQPEYSKNDAGEPTTFGAVSLVGDKQALRIDTILRQRLSPVEYRRRQILCGDSAQFQGDERDVMFLSVVDSPPAQPPLSMRQEGPKKIFKKRFNVAASRARNQMWVVHSLNHESDLQAGDYRRRLIEHSIDPHGWERELQVRLSKIDQRSKVFEGAVLRRLMERGYHVVPQFQAGAFYIDLVVIGAGRRLAIECDGEQFHGPEQLQDDIARQAVLERLGWTFVRIRGSIFFRNEDRALEPVFRRLEELGIPPGLKTDTAVSPDIRNEAIERVIREAEKLRAMWRTESPNDTPEPDMKSR